MKILYILALLFYQVSSPDLPNNLYLSRSGKVEKETIKQAEKILEVTFKEKPKSLFYYSSKPDKAGMYDAFLKATITKKEFLRIMDMLNLKKVKDHWPDPSLAKEIWWNPPDLEIMYRSPLKGEDPTFFANYYKGVMYFYKSFLNYAQF